MAVLVDPPGHAQDHCDRCFALSILAQLPDEGRQIVRRDVGEPAPGKSWTEVLLDRVPEGRDADYPIRRRDEY